MMQIRFLITLIFLLLPLGCSAVGKAKPKSTKGAAATVEVTPWFGSPTTIPLQSAPTLALAIHNPKVDAFRSQTKSIFKVVDEKKLKVPNSGVKYQFDDRCVVLSRGNVHWYFFEPFPLMELFTGEIALKSGDKLHTLPFVDSRWIVEKEVSMPQVAWRDISGKLEVDSLDKFAKGTTTTISDMIRDAEPLWSVALITRVDGESVHHLVVPAPLDSSIRMSKSVRDSLDPTILLTVPPTLLGDRSAYIKNGDLFEKLTLSGFQERFLSQ